MKKRAESRLREVSRLAPKQRLVRSQFTLWGSSLEHDATEMIPTILWIALGLYIAWLFLFLFTAIDNKPITDTGLDLYLVIFRALTGGVVPIVGAYGIGSDKHWMRWYIPLSFGLLLAALVSNVTTREELFEWPILTAASAFIVITILMVFSPVVRSYYAAIRANRDYLREQGF